MDVSPDERWTAADGGPPRGFARGVYSIAMSPGNDNQVDWKAATTPQGERVGPGLARRPKSQETKSREVAHTPDSVMETLLGASDLSAQDAGGSDPYNATGRHFRR
jgi:hypothetical protein